MTKEKQKIKMRAGRPHLGNKRLSGYISRWASSLIDDEVTKFYPRKNVRSYIINQAIIDSLMPYGPFDKLNKIGIKVTLIDTTQYLIKKIKRENGLNVYVGIVRFSLDDDICKFQLDCDYDEITEELIRIVDWTLSSNIKGINYINCDIDSIFESLI
jgi:hypothetical protein